MNRRSFIRAAVVVPVAAAFGIPRVRPIRARIGWLCFGPGTPVLLHGREKVVPWPDFDTFNQAADSAVKALAEFDRGCADLERSLDAWVQTEMRNRALYERLAAASVV